MDAKIREFSLTTHVADQMKKVPGPDATWKLAAGYVE
jgi:hypothetical protein